MIPRAPVLVVSCLLLGGCNQEVPPPVAAGDAAAPLPVVEPAVAGVTVVEVRGGVEARRGGNWSPVEAGATLPVSGAVRTESGGRATLGIGDGARVDVEGSSEVTLTAVDGAGARVRLERGRVGADLGDGGTTLAVESAGSTAVAAARRGTFTVFNDGRGLVAVAATSGEVKLTSSGGDTVVASGAQAEVRGDAAPSGMQVPESVFLNVSWPASSETRASSILVAGNAPVGSVVQVNGVVASVDATGRFKTPVELKEGRNNIEVEATDLLGRTTVKRRDLTVDRKAPRVKAKSDGLWE